MLERTHQIHVDIAIVSPGSERHKTQLELIQPHHEFLLLRLIKHQEAVNAKSRRLFPGSAQQPSRMNVEPSKGRKTNCEEDHVGFSRDESALDRKRDFLGCVERSRGRNGGR